MVIGNGRIVADGTKSELLAAAGTLVRTADPSRLTAALGAEGLSVTVSTDGALMTEAAAELVGSIALRAGVALTELRPADSAGLEEMFLELTAETQREGATAA